MIDDPLDGSGHQSQKPNNGMEYLAIPFTAGIAHDGNAAVVAEQLRILINSKAAEGWHYMHLESVTVHVAGTNGCFGYGATPGRMTSTPIAVFQR